MNLLLEQETLVGVNMAHYAFLNQSNIVTEVIVGRDEDELGIDWEEYYGNIKNVNFCPYSCRRRDGPYEIA